MKKTISLLLALLLVTSCFAFCTPDANALGALWVKEFYKDKFGDKTEQFYITNKSQFKGTYNSDSANDVKLGAKLIFERDGDELLAYLKLFLNGKDELHFEAWSENIDISVKRADESVFDTTGIINANENRLQIADSIELADALRVAGAKVKMYLEDSSYRNNSFLFVIDCDNFKTLFEKEILIPYQEEKYQLVDHLLDEKMYDEAYKAFLAIGAFGDDKESEARYDEIAEALNPYIYAKAESELENKNYDSAIELFLSIKEYADSSIRAEKVYEAKCASLNVLPRNMEELLMYQQQNTHVIGLLDIPGTEIHYPILQHPTEDNYYLQTAIDGEQSRQGSIYTNLMEGQNFDTFNTVIYGMNLSDGGMFTSLKNYDDVEYMKSHREIHIYTDTEEHIYQVCADVIYDDRYITYVYDDAKEEDRAAFLRSLRGGMWLDDVTVDTSSHIITLSTSIGGMPNNRRLIIAVEENVKNITEINN